MSDDYHRVRVLALSEDSRDIPGEVVMSDPLRLAMQEEAFLLNGVVAEPGGSAFSTSESGAAWS